MDNTRTPHSLIVGNIDSKVKIIVGFDIYSREAILSLMQNKKLQEKWDKKWKEAKIYNPDLKKAEKPFYNLYMFPYPSAEGLHVGHAFSSTGADVYARLKRMQGHDVFQPMGFDAFGIHSENYAIKISDHPKNLIDRATKRFRQQFESLGLSYDWTYTVNTSDPSYYKWTQWIFIKLFNAGLAEKRKAPVNWCPSCKTVLADEQVIKGTCERCGSLVEKKELEQWFFKITDYADRLLEDLEKIDWTQKVVGAQRNWIGRKEGVVLEFAAKDAGPIEVFTTRPDTFHGATFIAISPMHHWLNSVKNLEKEVLEFIENEKRSSESDEKDKKGVFTGYSVLHPLTGEEIPVWVVNYLAEGYGTGAVMGVPAHDARDHEFAKKYNLPIKEVIEGTSKEIPYEGVGDIINSGEWNGLKYPEDIDKILVHLEQKGVGKRQTNYHLRDWLISRQRYWGAPIPMIFCEDCNWQPVKEEDLPVLLPFIENFKPLGTGVAPLAQDDEFVNTTCPKCGKGAKRETDVCDTFLDSAWYFLRYPSSQFDTVAFDQQLTNEWLPVNMYIGGAEHSVLHLLYSRFITKVLYDLKLINFDEPFPKFRAHGLLIKDGSKMSKSKGNVVNPDEYINKFGADILRLYLMFLGPFNQGGDFRDSGIEGMDRFLKRVVRLIDQQLEDSSATFLRDQKIDFEMNKAIQEVTSDIESLYYNTSIAHIMEYLNVLTHFSKENRLDLSYIKTLVLLLAPFAPYTAEDLWQRLGAKDNESIHLHPWPVADKSLLVESEVTIVVQVNGRLRDTLRVSLHQSKNQEEIEKLAHDSEKVNTYIKNGIKKVIYVEGKILNFVA